MNCSPAQIRVAAGFLSWSLILFAEVGIPTRSQSATLTFQQGSNGYTGTVDTTLRADLPTNNFSSSPTLYANTQPSAAPGHSLIRFDQIFGAGPNQIPFDATILSATLRLRTSGSVGATTNALRLHRMLIPWSANDTWNTLGAGVAPDNVEAMQAFDAEFTPLTTPRFDSPNVLASLQSWSAGTSNYGWAILPTGPDSWTGDSSESATTLDRPLLTVSFLTDTVLPPSIVTQPQSKTNLLPGAAVQLSVSASGSNPQYLWFKEGQPIPGATNSALVFPSVRLSDNGTYYVVVSNSVGVVTSSNAVLAVPALPMSRTLIHLTNHVWKYDQRGIDLGAAWRSTNYDDSTWPSGRGVFALESNIVINALTNTVLSLTGTGTVQIPTFYFRTHFVVTNDLLDATLLATNYVDDGSVIYLNGSEALRYNMPSGSILYNTLAPAANPAGEGIPIVTNLPSSLLRQGTNVIAVEVHQNSLFSSDVVFGVELILQIPPPTPPAITSQPADAAVEEAKSAVFRVGVAGRGVRLQWFREETGPIPDASEEALNIAVATANHAGGYFVVVSNEWDVLTSRVARLTVFLDTNAPLLVEADGTSGTSTVLLSFSEAITSETATNQNNYRITNTITGATLAIASAIQTSKTNVLLTTAPRASGHNYILVANGIRDISMAGNLVKSNSAVPITSLVRLIAPGGTFAFFDPFPPFDPPTPPENWKDQSFVPGPEWGVGQSVFFFGPSEFLIPGPIGTRLSSTPVISSFFRKTFDLNASPGGLRLVFNHIIDDGAVFYLNGAELFRFNMPDRPVDYDTLPPTNVATAVTITTNILNSGLIRQGANVLAVELHQFTTNDLDKIFGLELDAVVQSYVIGPVVLTRSPQNTTVFERESVTFDVMQAAGSAFQWFQNDQPILGATNAVYSITSAPVSLSGTTFHVTISNSINGFLSDAATLTVVADTTPPALLSAVFTDSNALIVAFSERINAASATNAMNYVLSNATGGRLVIRSVALHDGTNVIVTAGSGLMTGSRLVVNGVRDLAATPNIIAPNSTVTVGFRGPLTVVSLTNSIWRYNQTGNDLGTAWREVGYNDLGPDWFSGRQFFGLEPDSNTPVPGILTPWTIGDATNPKITYYLRTSFVSPITAPQATLRLRYVLDDAAVFYLNGVEIQRTRLPAGVINYRTEADVDLPVEGVFEFVDVLVTNLLFGQNLLAVEVHQTSLTSSDVVFGTEVMLLDTGLPVLPPPPQISVQPQSRTNRLGDSSSFNVVATSELGLHFQWGKNGVPIAHATNAIYTINFATTADAGIYSVVVSNPGGSVTSADAVLAIEGGCVPSRLAFHWTGATLVLSWTNPPNCTSVLQRASVILNPNTVWTDVTDQPPFSVPATNISGFYRLKN